MFNVPNGVTLTDAGRLQCSRPAFSLCPHSSGFGASRHTPYGLRRRHRTADEMRKATFYRPKGRVLQAKRPCFTVQKVTYRKDINNQAVTNCMEAALQAAAERAAADAAKKAG